MKKRHLAKKTVAVALAALMAAGCWGRCGCAARRVVSGSARGRA